MSANIELKFNFSTKSSTTTAHCCSSTLTTMSNILSTRLKILNVRFLSPLSQPTRMLLTPCRRQLSISSALYTQQSTGKNSQSDVDSRHINPAFIKRLADRGLTIEDLIARQEAQNRLKNRTSLFYALSVIIATLALSYASVPFYRLLCQKTGWAGTPITDSSKFTPEKLIPVQTDRKITVYFESDVSKSLPWTFEPQQSSVTVVPGETALAFFKATNKSEEDIIGVATYKYISN